MGADACKVLKQIPIFSGFSPKQLERLCEFLILRKYPKGKNIFTPGEKAEGFYILKSGKVVIYKIGRGREQVLRIFSAPAIFGEAASFMGSNFPAWADALEPSEVLFLPRTVFISEMRRDPEIGMRLMAVMAQRLFHLTSLIESLSLKDALSRVASYILGRSRGEGSVIDFRTGLVAMELGLTKETVSRMLSKLKSLGIIEKSGNKIKIKNLQALSAISG